MLVPEPAVCFDQSSFFTFLHSSETAAVCISVPARDYFVELNIELDLKRMFPSLKRQKLQSAYSDLITCIQKMFCYKRADKSVYFSVAKGSKTKLDTMHRAKIQEILPCFSGAQLIDRLVLEGYLNDLFQVGAGIHEQFIGVSISGTPASQNADTILMDVESVIHWDVKWPPHTKLSSYGDNVGCLCPKGQLFRLAFFVKRLLHRVYQVPLRL